MIELAHFIHFIGFAFGLVALYICFNLLKLYKTQVIKAYLFILLGINAVLFIHALEAFFKSILSDEVYDASTRIIFVYFILILAPIRLFVAAKTMEITYLWKRKSFPLYFYIIPLVYFIVFVVLAIGVQFSPNLEVIISSTFIFSIHLVLNVALFYFAITAITKKAKDDQNFSLKLFGFAILIYSIGSLFFRAINYPAIRMHEDPQMLALGILDVIFNVANIVFLKKMFVSEKAMSTDNNTLEKLFNQYGITSREKEIIELICEGKTNKEIAEILFISPITVRDHNSNIFRKTKVKNRTQLARLFQTLIQ